MHKPKDVLDPLKRTSQRLPFRSLGNAWHDASELATLLQEGGLTIDRTHAHKPPGLAASRSQIHRAKNSTSLAERIQTAQVLGRGSSTAPQWQINQRTALGQRRLRQGSAHRVRKVSLAANVRGRGTSVRA